MGLKFVLIEFTRLSSQTRQVYTTCFLRKETKCKKVSTLSTLSSGGSY